MTQPIRLESGFFDSPDPVPNIPPVNFDLAKTAVNSLGFLPFPRQLLTQPLERPVISDKMLAIWEQGFFVFQQDLFAEFRIRTMNP
jgi:hypothetical protein